MAVSGLPGEPTIRRWTRCCGRPRSARRWSTGPRRSRWTAAALLPPAVDAAREHLAAKRDEWAEANAEPLRDYRAQLDRFEQASLRRLPRRSASSAQRVHATVQEQSDLLARLETAGDPLLRVLAVLVPLRRSAAMSFESLTNRGEYLSAHYLAEILPTSLKRGLLKRVDRRRRRPASGTPRTGLRGLRRTYFDAKAELADLDVRPTSRRRD